MMKLRPALKLRPLLLLWVLSFALLAPAPRTQGEAPALPPPESDDQATSVEARQHALSTLLAAAQQLRADGETLAAARALNRAARFQVLLNQPQDALATYQEARTLLQQTPDPATNIDSLNGLGEAYNRLSKCDEAQALLQQAISLSEQHSYPAGKATALLVLSDCQNFSDHARALNTAQQALALWQSLDYKRGIAQAYAAIGHYQLTQNNLTQATESHQEAFRLWGELNVPTEQAEALINLGFIEYRKAAWQNVFMYLTQAQDLLDPQAEPYKMGQITAGCADAFIESGMPETGLAKYRQALEYYQQTQNPRAKIVMVWGIGRTYYLLGNYTEAVSNLQSALADAEAIKEPTVVAMCSDFLGQTYAAMNDRAAALRHFEAALTLYSQVGNPMEAARVRALMGQVYQQEGKIDKARQYYQTALKTFRALSDHVNQSATLYALGSLELQQNKLDQAEEYLRQAIEVTENIRRVSSSRDLTAAFSATVYGRYETYIECLMRKHHAAPARGLDASAFETSELARARSLTELLRAVETNLVPGLDPQLAEQEKSLRQSLRVKEDYKVGLLGRDYKKEELAALEADLACLEAEYKRVTDAIRKRYPAYEQITRPAAWDLRQIQEQVIADDQTVLLEYSFGAHKSYVWAVTRNGIKSYELPAQARLNAAAQKVYNLLATPPGAVTSAELNAATHELSQMVLSPVAAELNKRRVIVVADGALNYIPFQVLPAPAVNNDPLVADYEVINAPSASILGELRKEAARRQPAKVLAAFGDPVFASSYKQHKGTELVDTRQALADSHWRHALRDIDLNGDAFDPSVIKPLFYAKRELENLRDVAMGGETFLATEFAATREQLLSTDLTQYAILHFATHGLLDPKRPENSGLVLSTVNREGQAQNGFVGLQDIYDLRAPVDLVVLSACQTALGKDVRGEGLLGLTRGFMYAGASSVVASLWKVDDEATAELMRQFYANMLQKGMPPAAALRAAQNSIRQRPEWSAPYYWAAFTLQGEYRQVIKPAPAAALAHGCYGQVLTGLTLLALLAGLGWWYRCRRERMP
jgi:CHAT domain-containing protein/Tfp pilus assembly protein PilF